MEEKNNPEDKPEMANFEKKPPRKIKTIPAVRQTLTSYKRMLKANPLLQLQEAGIDINDVFPQRSLGSSLKSASNSRQLLPSDVKLSINEFKKPESKYLKRTQSLKVSKSSDVNLGIGRLKNQPLVSNNHSNTSKPNSDVQPKPVPKIKIDTKKQPPVDVKAKVNSFPKGAPRPKPTENNGTKPKSQPNHKKEGKQFRRSLSSGHLQTKKGRHFDPKQAYTKLNHSHSDEHLCIPVSNGFKEFSPIMEDNVEENFVFRTPSAYNRRSVCRATPGSNRKRLFFQASTPAPVEMRRLQERLNKWLKSRGKPPASFHHLRIFGANEGKKSPPPQAFDDEDKENVETLQDKSESYENLKIAIRTNEKDRDNKKEMSEEDLSKYAKEAMTELLKLINEDYPRDQCLGWLELIRDKYKKIDNEPEYWECRAALEQSAGNVQNAVEFYKTAIIQGAEVNAVDKSLDQLLQKFSLLNISPKLDKQNSDRGNKERIVREARNVFKSSIIQFAIRERNMKKPKDDDVSASAKKLVAIPVRRSTRLSRSGYTNTSGVKLCTSLKEIDLSAENVGFEKNKALC